MNGTLPADALPYRRTAIFDRETIPEGLRRRHTTRHGVWGLIRVVEGRLLYRRLDPVAEAVLDPETPGIIEPEQPHEVSPLGPVRFFIEFYARG